LYGRRWRELLEIPPGRRARHVAVTAAGVGAVGLGLASFSRLPMSGALALVGVAVWAAGTAEFAAARILPGPRDRREVATMVATSIVIPPAAVAHWLRGWWRWRNVRPATVRPARPRLGTGPVGVHG
jgi:hypothetical protein